MEEAYNMQYDFDRVVSRAKNFSAKYDERVKNLVPIR